VIVPPLSYDEIRQLLRVITNRLPSPGKDPQWRRTVCPAPIERIRISRGIRHEREATMTLPMRHTWLRRSFAVFAIAALLFTAGSSPASANKEVPQEMTTDEFKEFCELAGGQW
jgi:hypothetical protein